MAHPKSAEAKQAAIDTNPFEDMRISDTSILNRLDGRSPCPQCGKSRKYFCYTCYVPIAELAGHLPKLKLPIKIDIIKHKNEIDGKSTACHAALLAPDDVTIYTYPDIPNYDEMDQVVLIFPSADARSVQQVLNNNCKDKHEELPKGHHKGTLMKELSTNIKQNEVCTLLSNQLPVKRAVFIDSTWNQSRGIYKDDRVKRLPCVVIHNRISQFWRHQKGSPRWYLATIEAIHQFLLEIHVSAWGVDENYKGLKNCFSDEYICAAIRSSTNDEMYNGQYDNLLYFFKHMYDLIHAYYDHEQLYAYKRRLM
ncbi:uncharacterized protein CBL_06644 [Carabus blaptoides fortunei]